jgi:ATP-dependent DNA helicase HFM1/MER3
VRALQNRRPANPENFQPEWPNPVSSTRSKEGPAQNTGNATISNGRPVVQGIPLVSPADLPDKISTIFPFPLFNAVQSKCFNAVFNTDDNLVVSAPTGSGKTAVMELAIARLITSVKNADFKIVYMAPIKALCAERQQDWQKKFNVHGLACAELTGDTDFDQLRKVRQAQIIITTPEKWDSVTRKWRDNSKLVQMIKLFLVDEVHILKDSRGATLEAVVSRMKSVGTPIRFIALSATVPNSEDIAAWLGKDSITPQEPAQREVFDESFRPVQLEKHVYGFQGGFNDFQLDVKLRSK